MWFTDADPEPLTLAALVGRQATERQHQRAAEEARQTEDEQREPFEAASSFDSWASEVDLANALGDKRVVRALKVAVDQHRPNRAAWVERNRQQLVVMHRWWRQVAHTRPRDVPPQGAIAWLTRVADEVWTEAAKRVLAAPEANRTAPWGMALMARLLRGDLIDNWTLGRLSGPHRSHEDIEGEHLQRYDDQRARAVESQRIRMSFLQRRRTRYEESIRAFDSEHLLACRDCGVRNVKSDRREGCQVCHGDMEPVHAIPGQAEVGDLEDRLRTRIANR